VATAVAVPAAQGAQPLRFSAPQFVDTGLAGGEPLMFADHVHHTLVYTSHEGTTHLYRPGFTTTQQTFLTNYRNQVNIWVSTDDGKTWKFTNFFAGFAGDPTQETGFSDPDLTQDAGGRIYNTGIDLANDTLFSSSDGGKTWDRGTVDCHDGDRPWLAGAKKDEVFMATDAAVGGHEIFQSTDGGKNCGSTAIPDSGTIDGTSYNGYGRLLYDRQRDKLVEPIVLSGGSGLGTATWTRGDPTFKPGHQLLPTTLEGHFPSLALDAADTLYMVWDTDERNSDQMGCSDQSPTNNGASGSPLPNSIMLAVSKDLGNTWSSPVAIAHPGTRVLWPWVVAGDAGRISVVWYQSDKLADWDCQASKVSIYDANITGADSPATLQKTVVNAAGRPIHDSGVCQGGTTCVATGQDRRLGDFFTNALDEQGCVMIASGDTTKKDPITGGELPTSLPIIMRQASGPALIGDHECSGGTVAKVKSAACRDRAAPLSRITKRGTRISRRHLVVSGTASDRGCRKGKAHAAAGVARVSVAVGREVGHGRCRFLRAKGSYSPARSCSRPVYLRARGTKHWHLNFVGTFPAGHYRVTVRATDARRNVEHPGKLNRTRLRVT
jgi:hypothetical protein